MTEHVWPHTMVDLSLDERESRTESEMKAAQGVLAEEGTESTLAQRDEVSGFTLDKKKTDVEAVIDRLRRFHAKLSYLPPLTDEFLDQAKRQGRA